MTASGRAGHEVACGTCRSVNLAGERFCGGCGGSLEGASTDRISRDQYPPPHRTGPIPHQQAHQSGPIPHQRPPRVSPERRDSVTRYLCAATHLDAAFADVVIGEYLIERTRAMPFLPGLDTGAVVREAVAARYRRRLRDSVLLALGVLIAVVAFPLLAIWFFVALGVVVFAAAATSLRRYGPAVRLAGAVIGAVAGFLAVVSYWDTIGYPFGYLLYLLDIPANVIIGAQLGLLAALAVGVLIAVDEFAVTEVTRHHFRAPNFVPDATALPQGWLRSFRLMGHASYAQDLARVSATEREAVSRPGMADVIVHRHRQPFVGAGLMVRDQVLALPLIPDEESDEPPVRFTPLELHDHISTAVSALRNSASLSPGGRLSDLTIHEQVFVPAEQLLRDSGTSLRPVILPEPSRPPASQLDLQRARALTGTPQEAARYYRCYRVESWDRDLMTSSYFTAGTDLRTLYVEWTHCVLWPVHPDYRSIDRHQSWGPGRRAFESIVTFPVSVFERFAGLLHRLRPLPYARDEIEPARYGAGHSLREHAAAPEADSFFQEADALRYTQVIEQTIFKAIGTFLEDRHYSIDDVLGAAKANVVSHINIQNGNFTNSAIGGRIQQTNVSGHRRPNQGGRDGRPRP